MQSILEQAGVPDTGAAAPDEGFRSRLKVVGGT
jgi:hypothetical protein